MNQLLYDLIGMLKMIALSICWIMELVLFYIRLLSPYVSNGKGVLGLESRMWNRLIYDKCLNELDGLIKGSLVVDVYYRKMYPYIFLKFLGPPCFIYANLWFYVLICIHRPNYFHFSKGNLNIY